MKVTFHSTLLCIAVVLYTVEVSQPCALPYWWVEAYSLPSNSALRGSEPKKTYRYRESLQVFNPHNFVHVKEYTEYSWWEHHSAEGAPPPPPPSPAGKRNDLPEESPKEKPDPPPKLRATTATKNPRNRKKTPTTTEKNDVVDEREVLIERGVSSVTYSENDIQGKELSSSEMTTAATTTFTSTTVASTQPESILVETVNNSQAERNEKETASADLQHEELPEGGNDLLQVEKDDERGPSLLPPWLRKRSFNETRPCKASEADINSLRSMIEKLFSLPRDHVLHPEMKEKARQDILKKFRNFGLQVWTQNFTIPSPTAASGEEVREGVNLIGVIPSAQRGQMEDGIVLVGAHYDTVSESHGVDDNGSGLAVMLEVAKIFSEARCRLNNTLMFVAFDLEEDGAMGSNYFVENYLIPEELKRARAHFQGAFILDGVMNFNSAPNSQQLPRDFTESLPGLESFVNDTGNRGDFLAMISRNILDNHLAKHMMEQWKKLGHSHYKLFNLAVDMGNDIPSPSVIQHHLNFLNSDHATFWYHNSTSKFPETLNAVLLTDTGPFRGQMQKCYHSECDDLSNMSPEKLQFAKKTADALTATLVELTKATAEGCTLKANFWILMMFCITAFLSAKMM